MNNTQDFGRNSIISGIVANYPPLSFDEERSMIDDYLAKNDRAGLNEKLIMHNVCMIYTAARGWMNIYDMDDFISFGFEGLQKAAETFDTTRNIKFATYCTYPIKTAMRNHVREYINKISVNSVSLDAPIATSDEPGATYENFVDSDIKGEVKIDMHSTIDEIEDNDSMRHVFSMIKGMGLSDREYETIVMYFIKSMTLDEISKVIGKTRERARQIIHKGMSKIKRRMLTKYNIPYTMLKCPTTDMFRVKKKGVECGDSHLEWNGKTKRYDVVDGLSWYNSDIDWEAYDRARSEYNTKKFNIIKQMMAGTYVGEGVSINPTFRKLTSTATPSTRRRETLKELGKCDSVEVSVKKTYYTLPSGLKVVRV